MDASGDCPSGEEKLGQLGEQAKTVQLLRMICNPEMGYFVDQIESAQPIIRAVFRQRNGRSKNINRVRGRCSGSGCIDHPYWTLLALMIRQRIGYTISVDSFWAHASSEALLM